MYGRALPSRNDHYVVDVQEVLAQKLDKLLLGQVWNELLNWGFEKSLNLLPWKIYYEIHDSTSLGKRMSVQPSR